MSAFSERLIKLQTEKKILKKDIAAAIGVTYRHYQRYENDQTEPTLNVLIALAAYYNVSLDWLCGLSDTRERQP